MNKVIVIMKRVPMSNDHTLKEKGLTRLVNCFCGTGFGDSRTTSMLETGQPKWNTKSETGGPMTPMPPTPSSDRPRDT